MHPNDMSVHKTPEKDNKFRKSPDLARIKMLVLLLATRKENNPLSWRAANLKYAL